MQEPLKKIRGNGLDALTPEEHETIAAFRTRLADFLVHACTRTAGLLHRFIRGELARE